MPRGRYKLAALLIVASLLPCDAICMNLASQAREKRPPPDSRARVRRAIAAVGLVLVRDSDDAGAAPTPRGSGVVVRKDGLVATNHHVVTHDNSDRAFQQIFFRLDQEARPYRLEVVLLDKVYDLALLRIARDWSGRPLSNGASYPALELGNSRQLRPLDELVIIGYPEKGGGTVTVNVGVVEGKDQLGNWIKTDARLIHGNSGGAAVNNEGKLVGIPTKVVVDGDGTRAFGAVGFLRPAHLIAGLIARADLSQRSSAALGGSNGQTGPAAGSQNSLITIKGTVRSADGGKPIAGARVGITPFGSQNVTDSNLLSWGGTNPEGAFVLNKPIPPGRYTVRARAIGYDLFTLNVVIDQSAMPLIIDLQPSK
jgi:S1-C subfamily serine protease